MEQTDMPLLQVTLRPFRSSDLEAAVALWYRAWHATFPSLSHPQPYAAWRDRFQNEIAPRQDVWVAAEDGGKIVGFLTLMLAHGYLDQLFIEPAAQHRGVGAALMTKAKELSPGHLSLHTLQRNMVARAFYERHGFVAGEAGVNPVNGEPNVWYHWQVPLDSAN